MPNALIVYLRSAYNGATWLHGLHVARYMLHSATYCGIIGGMKRRRRPAAYMSTQRIIPLGAF